MNSKSSVVFDAKQIEIINKAKDILLVKDAGPETKLHSCDLLEMYLSELSYLSATAFQCLWGVLSEVNTFAQCVLIDLVVDNDIAIEYYAGSGKSSFEPIGENYQNFLFDALDLARADIRRDIVRAAKRN